jgi:hypothetical protein
MPNRALGTARTLTVTTVAAAALGTAVLGVHLATDHASTQAAPATLGGSSPLPQQSAPQQTPDPPAQAQPQSGGGFFSGFGQILPGQGGASHSGSGGS